MHLQGNPLHRLGRESQLQGAEESGRKLGSSLAAGREGCMCQVTSVSPVGKTQSCGLHPHLSALPPWTERPGTGVQAPCWLHCYLSSKVRLRDAEPHSCHFGISILSGLCKL